MDTSDPRVKDRSAKVERRKNRMPVNGIAMKRLLIERAAKAQTRCMAAKFLRHIGSTPATRHAIYAHCDRASHGEDGHHFVGPYGETV